MNLRPSPARSDETIAQHGAGTHVAARSTMRSAIFGGSSVVFTVRTTSTSASRRSTRLRRARWNTRSFAARSSPGVVSGISPARPSFEPRVPVAPTP